jgi:SAM-dependent MidA family methyltransferase
VGPLFGAVVAAALDRWWDDLGRPDPFVVVEAGAGAATLAAAVLAAAPACTGALHYLLVERSERLRAEAATRLHLEPARQVLGPILQHEEGSYPAAGTGPVATALAELPAGPFTGVVLANELLDNLPFRLLERDADRWCEVLVGLDGGGPRLVEVLVPAPVDAAAEADRLLAPGAPAAGARIPLQPAAADWLRQATALLRRGRVVVIDYADTTPSMATRPWTEWVRTYRGHRPGRGPLDDPGQQDVTCEVAVDQLVPPDHDSSQAEFLHRHGIDRLTDQARREWEARAHVGDLAAMAARSRVGEAAALTDPAGLGRFRVLEWGIGSRP